MKPLFPAPLFLCVFSQAFASFLPLTLTQRIQESDIIAVILCDRVESGSRAICKVIQPLMGTKESDVITVMIDSRIGGRDPDFQDGKQYLVFLRRAAPNRLVTVQSSLDAFEIKEDRVSHWELDRRTNKFVEPKLSDLIPVLEKLIPKRANN